MLSLITVVSSTILLLMLFPVFLRKRSLLRTGICALATALSLGSFLIQLGAIKKNDSTAVFGIDFIAYYTAAQMVRSGEVSEIYARVGDDFSVVDSGRFFETARRSGFPLTPTRYLYLPLFTAPVQPFTGFDFPTAANLWLALNLACLIAVVSIQWYLTGDIGHPFLRLAAIASINLSSFPLFYALKLGQTSILVYLVFCSIYLFTIKRWEIPAGVLLGLIISLKFTPLLFLLYFLYRKRYALVSSCLLTVVAVFLTSIAVYGLSLHHLYWNYLRGLSSLRIAAWSNQSVDAFLLRIFTATSVSDFAPVRTAGALSLLQYLIVSIVMGVTYLSLRGRAEENRHQAYPLEFSALILCLLITPAISWLHYFTLVTLAILISAPPYCRRNPRHQTVVIPLVAVSYAMISFHLNLDSLSVLFGQGFITKLLVSLPFLGTCLLFCLVATLMKTEQQSIERGRHGYSNGPFNV